MLRLSEAIDENEISVTINRRLTADALLLLSLPLFQKCLFNEAQHGNSANTVLSLGRVNVAVAAIGLMIVVNQSVVHINDPFIQIDVAPSQPSNFANPHSRAKHDRKHRVPVPILLRLLQEGQKQLLFCFSQCPPLLSLQGESLLQFLQNIVSRIAANVSIISRHFQDLMQNCVNAVNR